MAFNRRTIRTDTRELETLLRLASGQTRPRDEIMRYARGLGRSAGMGGFASEILGRAAGIAADVAIPRAASAARNLLNAMRWGRGGVAAKETQAREAREAVAFLQGLGIDTPLAEELFAPRAGAPPVQAPPVQPGYGGRLGGAGRGGRGGIGGGGGGRGGTSAPAPGGGGGAPPPPPQTQYPAPGSRAAPRDAPPRPGEESPFTHEIYTPQSSNVFSFAYDAQTSTLYVTFKAPKLNPGAVRRVRGRSGAPELAGKLGKTIVGKTNERGPMYAYFDVPARVYQRMMLAHSKGKFVWDELRVRGTVYGHQFRYRLMQGAVITGPGSGGVSGVYIPRRATRHGFRTRSVANVGTGRRGYAQSTLAEETRDFSRGAASDRGRDRSRDRTSGRGGREGY